VFRASISGSSVRFSPKAPDRSRAAARCAPQSRHYARSLWCLFRKTSLRSSFDVRLTSFGSPSPRTVERSAAFEVPPASYLPSLLRCSRRYARCAARPSHASRRPAARPLRGSQPAPARAGEYHRIGVTGGISTRAGLSESEALARYGRSAIFRYSGRGRPLVAGNDVSTATSVASEERSELAASSGRGLP
jgi:hypothetical protein